MKRLLTFLGLGILLTFLTITLATLKDYSQPVIPDGLTKKTINLLKPISEPTVAVLEEKQYIEPEKPKVVAVPAYDGSCGDNWYANWIYMHESSCRLDAKNSIGCVGIGQDCNGALIRDCPNLDYPCQNAFFTRYMQARYGSWQSAYEFWVSRHWW